MVILMTMSSTLPLAEVKSHLSELVSRVSTEHDRVTVTVHGRPSAMLLAVEDVEALEETIAILSDAETMRQLIQGEAEIARGEGETLDQLAEAMGRRRGSA
jgi:antitoxin YefM